MQKYRGNEYELKISRLKMSDKGLYTVIAENSFGKREEHATLKVEGYYTIYLIFCHFCF